MDSTTTLNDSAISEIESTLFIAPSTSFFNRVEHDITFRSDPHEIESQPNLVSSAATELTNLRPKSYKEKDIEYIEVLLNPEGKRATSAWYWDHGKEWECQKKDSNEKKSRIWVCSHCPSSSFRHYSVHGSNKINDHLLKAHRLKKDGPLPSRTSITVQLQRHNPQALPSMSDVDRKQIQKTKFKAALVAFICCCHVAFRLVENPWFITLLSTLSDLVADLVPDSHNTARKAHRFWQTRNTCPSIKMGLSALPVPHVYDKAW